MTHSEFNWKDSQGLSIYAQEWKPEGPARGAVALVHGLGEHSSRYAHVAGALNREGFGLVSFDLPGHGRSGGTRGHASFDGILIEIDHLLEETARRYPGIPRFLYGHSLGGGLVLYYTLKRQPAVQGVIATSPGLIPGTKVPASTMLLAKVMSRVMPSYTLPNGLDVGNLSRDPSIAEAYKKDPLVHDRISARLGLDLLTKGEWTIANANTLAVPLLLVQGDKDHLVSPEATCRFAEAAPKDKITYKVWEGFYHETHNEPEKTQVIQYMIDWICRHT